MATENLSLSLRTTSSKVYINMNEAMSDVSLLIQSMKLYASPAGAGGGKREETPMDKKVKGEDATDNINNKKAADGQDTNESITDPDTNLTGDTGNLNEGQTDLGASGTGAENI